MENLSRDLQSADPNQRERALKKALQTIFDTQLKDEIAKEIQQTSSSKYRIGTRTLIGMAASLLFIVALITLLPKKNISDLASSYVTSASVFHPGINKGNAENNKVNLDAIQAFNRKEYESAVDLWSSIPQRSPEINYFLGLANLQIGNYAGASRCFEEVLTAGRTYQQEAKWYRILSIILLERNVEARKELESLSPEFWKYQEGQKLLRKLK